MSYEYDIKRCPRCGAQADASATSCPFCGEPLPLSPAPSYDAYGGQGEDTVVLPGGGAQQPSSYGQSPYGQPTYEQQQYGQQPYGQPAYEQQRYCEPYQTPYQPAPRKKSKGKGSDTLMLVIISLASLIIAGVVTFFLLENLNKSEEATALPDTASTSVTTTADSVPTPTAATDDAEVAAEAAAFEDGNDIDVIDRDHIAALANRLQVRSRELTKDDLAGLNAIELRYLRNYIFAQYGLIFRDGELRDFFAGYSWYRPTSTDVSDQLSSVEKKNVLTIKSLE